MVLGTTEKSVAANTAQLLLDFKLIVAYFYQANHTPSLESNFSGMLANIS